MTKKRRFEDLKLDLDLKRGCNHKQPYRVLIILVLLLLPTLSFAGVAEQLKEAEGLIQGKQYDQAEKAYKAVLAESTDKDQQLAAQKGLALLYITANKPAQADTAYQQMEDRFAGNAGLSQAVYEIGRQYKDGKQTDKAFQVYQSVISKWKETEWAIHSQRDIIHSHLERSDDKAANAAVDTLLMDFANHKDIAGTIYNLGKHYRNLKRPDIGLKLHQYNVEHYAKDVQGMYSQVEVIKSAIGQGDDAGSEKEFARLVQVFAGQATLPKEVYQVGIAYSKANKPEQARQYYQYVVDHWPDSDAAIRAQVAIIDKDSPPGANTTVEEAFDRLIRAFSQKKIPSKEVYQTAMRYRQTRPIQARQVHQYNAEQSSKDDINTMWSQTEVAKSYIRDGNDSQAEAAANKLMSIFSKQPTLLIELCRVGDTYLQVGKIDKANQTYQYVLGHTVELDGQRIWAKAGLIKLEIAKGNDAAVWQALDALIAEFKDHPDAAEAVFQVSERYIDEANARDREDQRSKADEYHRRAMGIWDRIMREFPASDTTAQVCHLTAESYDRLGEDEKAMQYYQTVAEKWPDYQYAWLAQHRTVRLYQRLKEKGVLTEAEVNTAIQSTYTRIVQLYPQSPAAKVAQKWLERATKTNSIKAN